MHICLCVFHSCENRDQLTGREREREVEREREREDRTWVRKDGETMNGEEVSTKCSGVQDTPDTKSGWTLTCSQHFTGTTGFSHEWWNMFILYDNFISKNYIRYYECKGRDVCKRGWERVREWGRERMRVSEWGIERGRKLLTRNAYFLRVNGEDGKLGLFQQLWFVLSWAGQQDTQSCLETVEMKETDSEEIKG